MKTSQKSVIVLAMHGVPANDFPKDELQDYFDLHTRWEHGELKSEALRKHCLALERKIRIWPRTAFNDPFFSGSLDLAGRLEKAVNREVIVGFNEFCSPSLKEALYLAAQKTKKVIIITPMMTRGGEHAEREIPAAIQGAREAYPLTLFIYVWPFETKAIAEFMATQIASVK
jgi:sirohydrochlorin cobaltochelatase